MKTSHSALGTACPACLGKRELNGLSPLWAGKMPALLSNALFAEAAGRQFAILAQYPGGRVPSRGVGWGFESTSDGSVLPIARILRTAALSLNRKGASDIKTTNSKYGILNFKVQAWASLSAGYSNTVCPPMARRIPPILTTMAGTTGRSGVAEPI